MPKNKLFSVKKDIIIPLKGGGIMAQGKQNVTTLSHIGAQKHKRVKWSLLYCSLFRVTIGGTIEFLLHFCGEFCMELILGFFANVAIAYGMIRSTIVTHFCLFMN